MKNFNLLLISFLLPLTSVFAMEDISEAQPGVRPLESYMMQGRVAKKPVENVGSCIVNNNNPDFCTLSNGKNLKIKVIDDIDRITSILASKQDPKKVKEKKDLNACIIRKSGSDNCFHDGKKYTLVPEETISDYDKDPLAPASPSSSPDKKIPNTLNQ